MFRLRPSDALLAWSLGALCALCAAASLAWALHDQARASALDAHARAHAAFAQSLALAARRATGSEPPDWERALRSDAVDQLLRELDGVRVRVIGLDGLIRHSTLPSEIGTPAPGRRAIEDARRGSARARVQRRAGVADLDGRSADRTLVISVVPIRLNAEGAVEGVLELWSDRSDEPDDAGSGLSARVALAVAVVAGLAAVFVALWLRLAGVLRRTEAQRDAGAAQLHQFVTTDALTGLPNRGMLLDRLGRMAESVPAAPAAAVPAPGDAATAGAAPLLALVEIDGFRELNDLLGRSVGDELLRQVGQRIGSVLRVSPEVYRVGGAQFAVVVEGARDRATIDAIARRLLQALAEPVAADGQSVLVSASIGFVPLPQPGAAASTLLRCGEAAIARARQDGPGHHALWDPSMSAVIDEHARLRRALATALHDGEFRLVYQPRLTADGRTTSGVEALLRWRSKELGDVDPAVFVPDLEESGLIVEVGAWVLREACRQAGQWVRGRTPVTMAVNVSAQQLRDGALVRAVSDALKAGGLAPAWLQLELSERTLVEQPVGALDTLRDLRRLGVGLTLDGFGTGWSSITQLKSLPLDAVSIARDFIADIPANPRSMVIARAIAGMARGLGLRVVALGVETEAQQAFLHEIGCDEVQGFLLGRPLPPEDVGAQLSPLVDRVRAGLPIA